MNIVFGKYIDNGSILTKVSAKIKLLLTTLLMIMSFISFNFYVYLGFSLLIVLLTFIGKLSVKPIWTFLKSIWVLVLIVLVINVLIGNGYVLFSIGHLNFYLNGIVDTVYIVLRLINILLISNLLTATTNPGELTYALEFYLKPLRVFSIDPHDIAIMMSIAIRFIPTLLEESDKIIKAQTSRGVDFKHGKYLEKTKAMVSIVVPLFTSCFEKSEDLSEAMLVKGYGMGKRSEYKREAHKVINIFAIIACVAIIALCFVLNGVI